MEEIFDMVIHCFGVNIDPDKVFMYLKNEYSKSQAWSTVCREGLQHQWRKCHTKNYWVWLTI